MLKSAKLIVFLGLFLFSLVFVQGVLAQQVLPGNTNLNEETMKTKMGEAKNEKVQVVQNKAGTDAAMVKSNALSQARLKICQSREERISNRFTNLKSLGAQVQQAYEGHMARVDYYYVNTLVPQGFVLQNYEALKAQIDSNKVAVNAAMEQVRLTGQDFSCNSEDPKGQADAFRLNMSALIAANKEYKTSVREFVVAVRELAKVAKADTLSVSPTVSPVLTPETEVSPAL